MYYENLNYSPNRSSMSSDQLYQDTLAGYNTQINRAEGLYADTNRSWNNLYNQQKGFGESSRLNMEANAARDLASAQSSAMNRGLYSSSAYDTAVRGSQNNSMMGRLTLEDQLYSRQNQIWQGMLGYQAQAQPWLTNTYGQKNNFMGNVQQSQAGYENQMALLLRQQEYAAALEKSHAMERTMEVARGAGRWNSFGPNLQGSNVGPSSPVSNAPRDSGGSPSAPPPPSGGGGPNRPAPDFMGTPMSGLPFGITSVDPSFTGNPYNPYGPRNPWGYQPGWTHDGTGRNWEPPGGWGNGLSGYGSGSGNDSGWGNEGSYGYDFGSGSGSGSSSGSSESSESRGSSGSGGGGE